MAYPSTVTSFTNPVPSDRLNSPSHSSIETAQNTGLTEIQTFVGTTNTSAVGTLVYDIRSPDSNGGGHVQTANKGGTGQTSFNKGDILVAQSSSVLTKLAVGSNGQSLVVNTATATGLNWGSVAGLPSSVASFIPKGFMDTQISSRRVNNSALGIISLVNVPNPITVSTLTVRTAADSDAVTTSGAIRVTLYEESGVASVLTVTTPTMTTINTNYPTSISPVKALNPGNYYVMTNPTGGTNVILGFWNANDGTSASSLVSLGSLSGRPVHKGFYSIAAGAPPASIKTSSVISSAISTTETTTVMFRLDG